MGCACASAHDNGLARTPPMGWNTFNCWSGEYDATMVEEVAQALAGSGMRDLGYVYDNIDGGWNNGSQSWLPDSGKFPAGIAPVADYVHSQGCKLGIYVDSAQGQETNVANRFAGWGVDFLKHDDYVTPVTGVTWTRMRDALIATGRPILYSIHTGGNNGSSTVANMWRTGSDIDNNWSAVMNSIGTHATDGSGQPGAWPDPDMLEVGNMNNDIEEMTHFSLWCVTSSPLIAGNDIRAMFLFTQYILQNSEAIAVNQDIAFATNGSYGGSGKRVKVSGALQVWLKTLTNGAKGVVLVNTGTITNTLAVNWSDIGLPSGTAQVRDLWEHTDLGSFTDSYSAPVPGHGCKFLKIVAGSDPIAAPPARWTPKPAASRPITALSRTGWSITSNLGNPGVYIDGDIDTPSMASGGGHTNWLVVDMKAPQTFNCVLLNSPVSGVDIAWKPYRVFASENNLYVYVSDNGTTWQGPVYSGYVGPKNYCAMGFAPQTARYIKVAESCARSDLAQGYDTFPFSGQDGGQVTELHVGNVTNHAPVVQTNTSAVAIKNQPLTLSLSQLTATATDADDDLLTVSAADTASTNGGTVSLTSSNLVYQPSADYTGADEFTCVITDSRGGLATNTVALSVLSRSTLAPTVVYGPVVESGHFTVRFSGAPGVTYTIQSAAPLSPLSWTPRANLTAPAQDQGLGIGVFELTDTLGGGSGQLYRAVFPPAQ
jgi:alpha-galactosidase